MVSQQFISLADFSYLWLPFTDRILASPDISVRNPDNPVLVAALCEADSGLKCNNKPPFLALQIPPGVAWTLNTYVACCLIICHTKDSRTWSVTYQAWKFNRGSADLIIFLTEKTWTARDRKNQKISVIYYFSEFIHLSLQQAVHTGWPFSLQGQHEKFIGLCPYSPLSPRPASTTAAGTQPTGGGHDHPPPKAGPQSLIPHRHSSLADPITMNLTVCYDE